MAEQTMPVSAEPTLVETNPNGAGAFGPQPQGWQERVSSLTSQPAFRRALPALLGVGAIAAVALVYLAIAGSPQRMLYGNLSDSERLSVVEALDSGGIAYQMNTGTGAITVAEDDFYRAKMLLSSDGGVAAPQGASEMLDSIPLGSSRTLEGERLRMARERELMLTIQEIDAIEGVRVHLATPERSVFVRNSNPPSASVMLRLVSGRSLGERQVEAIVNLVAASVPGMTSDSVRVVDQNGRLLSAPRDAEMDALAHQREFEAKLQGQLATLLTPLLGEGNFSSQVQVELDQNEVTSARETYDKEGAVRSENERNVTRMAARQPGGVPGVPANTPPPEANLLDGPPEPGAAEEGGEDGQNARPTPTDSENAIQRAYELDREVAVTARRAGGLTKLSVAVAVSQEAMVAAAPLTAEELEALVSAAVGADTGRGDMVKIAVSAFESREIAPLEFYEENWFALALRYGTALIAVLMVLLLAVRPILASANPKSAKSKDKKPKGKKGKQDAEEDDANALEGAQDQASLALQADGEAGNGAQSLAAPDPYADLPEQVRLARTLATQQPERALDALQRMLQPPGEEPEKAAG